MNIHIFVLFAVVVCFGFVQCNLFEYLKYAKECGKEHNLTIDTMKGLLEKAKQADFVPTEDQKCVTKCLLDKSKMVKDKQLDVAGIKKAATSLGQSEKAVQAGLDKCGPLYKGADTCDEIYSVAKCVLGQHK